MKISLMTISQIYQRNEKRNQIYLKKFEADFLFKKISAKIFIHQDIFIHYILTLKI